jgi:ammonium transporter, Amt family
MAGAAAALAGVLLLGARKGKYGANGQVNAIPGANLPLATLGTFILWMGWFGFNGGSQLIVSDIEDANAVAMVFVNTNMAAAGGPDRGADRGAHAVRQGRPDHGPQRRPGRPGGHHRRAADPERRCWPTLIGAVGGVLVVFSILGLDKLKIDDPVGAISVHGVVGIWGLLAVAADQ